MLQFPEMTDDHAATFIIRKMIHEDAEKRPKMNDVVIYTKGILPNLPEKGEKERTYLALLLLAAKLGDMAKVKSLCEIRIDNKALVNISNLAGRTALLTAAIEGHADIVKTLLGAGANVNATDKEDYTALICAAIKGHVETVHTLPGAGANVDAARNNGNTPLIIAAMEGHVDIVHTLLGAGANVDATDIEDYTALIWAANKGHFDIVKTLLGDQSSDLVD